MTPEERSTNAMARVMAFRDGRRFVFELLEQGGLMADTFSPDASVSAYHQGLRAQAVALYHRLQEVCFNEYLTMMKESKEDAEHDRTSNNGNGGNPDDDNGSGHD
jgi:hypothetical protein